MATYTVASGRLVCTGTDITTQGICNAVNANSGSLTAVNGSPASAVFYSSPAGYTTATINAELTIGNNSAASEWVIESQNISVLAQYFRQNKGDVRLGQKRANGTLSFGSRFAFDTTLVSGERWTLENGSWIRAYKSIIINDCNMTLAPTFGGAEFEGCYLNLLDGIGETGTYQEAPYQGQTITYKDCTFDEAGAVGMKLYLGYVNNGIDYILENTSVTNCLYAIQPGAAPLVLVDFKINTNTYHSVPNVGNANVTFINPDFNTLRSAGSTIADVHRLAYRYFYTALDANGAPLSDVKVRLFDQQGSAVVNNLTTDANGNVTLPTYNGIPVLMNKTYVGLAATARANHTFSSISYKHNIVAKGITADRDITDNVIYLDDTSITEQNPATVAAYTEINTGERLYDRAKLYLVENYAGQTETLITRSGNVYDLRTLNLVIDATAAADFAFDGTTITIKASTLTGNITTTGTVTLLNGATVDGVVSDANGVEVLIQTNTSEFGFYGEVDGVPLGAYVSGLPQKKVQITAGQTLKMVVGTHGYKSKYLEITTANTEDGFVILDRESAIDITVPQATKDAVVAGLASTLEAGPQLAIEVSQDFKDFTPTEFLSGFDYFIYTNSQTIAPLIVAAGTTNLYQFSEGTVTNFTPTFYVRLDDSITTHVDRGYYIPMVVIDGAPGVVSVRPNSSGLLLGTALWTKASANITTLDVLRIQDPLAKETTASSIKAKTDNLPADPAGVSDLVNVSTSAQLTVLNEGVKKASLGIPHSTDL